MLKCGICVNVCSVCVCGGIHLWVGVYVMCVVICMYEGTYECVCVCGVYVICVVVYVYVMCGICMFVYLCEYVCLLFVCIYLCVHVQVGINVCASAGTYILM